MLFVGDDWAEDHHDIEVVDEGGRRLGKRRFPEGIVGLEGLHALIADHLGEDQEPRTWWWGSRPTAGRGSRPWSPPATPSTR